MNIAVQLFTHAQGKNHQNINGTPESIFTLTRKEDDAVEGLNVINGPKCNNILS